MSDLRAGRVLSGKYRVDRILGKGGMGFVVEAFHLDLECRVAVKVLHAELRTNQELVDRFLREGKCAAGIAHEHVAKVFDVDRLEDGTPFLVMEYLVGHDLSVVRKSKTLLPRAEAIDYLLQACAAISEAHAQGIVHRDIKPANLFLTRGRTGKRTIKLLDFGISSCRARIRSPVGSTKSSVVMGSAEYMSPEQMLATKDADHRTDIWSLGVVLFELLTAQVPFSGETLTQVRMKLMSQPPERLSTVRPDLGGDLERVVLRCLEKDREHRFASVDELASALEACRAAPERAPFVETRAAATQPLPHLPPRPPLAHAAPRSLSVRPRSPRARRRSRLEPIRTGPRCCPRTGTRRRTDTRPRTPISPARHRRTTLRCHRPRHRTRASSRTGPPRSRERASPAWLPGWACTRDDGAADACTVAHERSRRGAERSRDEPLLGRDEPRDGEPGQAIVPGARSHRARHARCGRRHGRAHAALGDAELPIPGRRQRRARSANRGRERRAASARCCAHQRGGDERPDRADDRRAFDRGRAERRAGG